MRPPRSFAAGPWPRAARARLARIALPLALLAAGCAKKAPPSGGPPDITPPLVTSSFPDSGAARVARSARLSITFSEGMEPRSTNEAIALAPRVDVRQFRWSGRTVTLVLADSLRAGQTYTLFVGGGARDRHGNPLGRGATRVFSTADSFPPGMLEGEIQAHGFSAPGTYLWCYDAARHPGPDSTARDFDALGVADGDGRFRISGLGVPGRYRLWAFADLNFNRSYEPATDILAPADTTLELTDAHRVARGLVLRVLNPRAPARVRGVVVDTLGDSTGVLRVLAVSVRDSTRRAQVVADGSGAFDLQLAGGPWTLRAYRDLDRNRQWASEREPASAPYPVTVEPAADLREIRLVLRGPGGERHE